MQTINFFMPVNLETGHPTFQQPALWIGRAIITQETDYDDDDQPFMVDVAEITDLFFLSDALADTERARRTELPHNSMNGQIFLFKLKQAAVLAYHKPEFQQVEMPDEDYSWRVCDVKAMSDAINPAKP